MEVGVHLVIFKFDKESRSQAKSRWINNKLTMVYDSGSTAPFTASEGAMMKDTIVTLSKPIPVL